jgi:orotidine-5'-phosphate decarboxylase
MKDKNNKKIPLNERIIFALDVPDQNEARNLVNLLDDQIKFFKVGMELFFGSGWPIIDYITSRGNKVMLDLKLHDIPATVQLGIGRLTGHSITFTTVHGYGPVIQAAVDADTDMGIIAVTVLTSMDSEALAEQGTQITIEELVHKRAKKAIELGCHGIVCSAKEVSMLRKKLGCEFTIITPGIRPKGTSANDQQRISTPGQAIADGSDYLVIGRPIRDAASPARTVAVIQDEITTALTKRLKTTNCLT